MPRTISNAALASLYAPRTDDLYLVFATVDHEELSVPIRVVNDVVDYVYGGETFSGVPFSFELLSDTSEVPRGRVAIQNADRAIGVAVQNISSPPRLKLEVVHSDNFDLTQDPRVEAASPVTAEYVADYLILRNIAVDVMTVQADVESFDPGSEPWPRVRATKDRCPGLFL